MTDGTLKDIEKLEGDLWEAADELRANSKLTSTEYCLPVLGVIFLRHATNRCSPGLPASCRKHLPRNSTPAQRAKKLMLEKHGDENG